MDEGDAHERIVAFLDELKVMEAGAMDGQDLGVL